VAEPWSPVAQIATSTALAEALALLKLLADMGSSVIDLAQPQGVANAVHHSGDGNPGGFRPGIQEENKGLDGPLGPVLETNCKGVKASHHRSFLIEQESSPGRAGRHERPTRFAQDKNASVTTCKLGLNRHFGFPLGFGLGP
jgi:hypothetical protein